MKYYVGIDLGGTFIKGGVVNEKGEIVKFERIPTRTELGADFVISDIENVIKQLVGEVGEKVEGVGIGVPGLIDSKKGEVVMSGNLKWKNVMIKDRLQPHFSFPVRIANDANAAGLGEIKFGSGKKYSTSVFLTLGTGVGSGIVIDGKLFEGNRSAGAEAGHMIINVGGNQCTCGNKGCFETYASATALIRETVAAMLNDRTSKMWEVGSIENVNGKTAFDYYDKDESAKKVIDEYVKNLSIGIINIANILRPEAIIIGGGVAKQGKNLSDRVQKLVDAGIFARELGPRVDVLTASLEEAGVVGAASLAMQ